MAAAGHANNFSLLRLLAAWLVLYAHSDLLTGHAVPRIGGMGPGQFGVLVFFVISGYLVSQSFERSSPLRFAVARALRIYPALIVSVLATALLIGPALTSLDAAGYFGWPLARHIITNGTLMLFRIDNTLPGLFAGQPYPDTVNGSLWTLPWELLMYAMVFLLGVAGLLTRLRIVAALWLASIAVHAAWYAHDVAFPQEPVLVGFSFAAYFFAGVMLYRLRERLRYDRRTLPASIVLAVLAAVGLERWPLTVVLFVPAFAWLVLNLAYVPRGPILAYNRLGDYSYGTYLFAFPVQQGLVALGLARDPLALTLLATGVVLPIAVASWHFVEAPALSLKSRIPGSPLHAKPLRVGI